MIKIFFVVLLALMSLSMVITLIPGMTGITTDPNAIEVVAEVGGEKITTFDVQQGVLQLGRNNQVPAEMLWLYTEQVLDQLVLEKASVLQAERMGLRVSQEDLLMRLRLIPDLFPGGKFVGRDQYESMILERFGASVADFENRFRNSLLMEKLRQVVTDSIGVSQQEVREAFLKDNEKLVLHYVFFEPSAYKKDIAVTDAVLTEYYEQNKDRYQLPEQRKIQALMLETKAARETVAVTDAEKQRYYQDHLDSYRQQERASVRHVLFRATDKEPEKLEAARKKAEDVLQQLKAGTKFEEIAKKDSEDTATAVNGGDLGWIVRGQTVPNFEKAAFSLAPGTISEPIQTEYGIHILKVTEHEQARVRPLEEVQPEIQSLLLDEKAQNAISASAEQAAADWRRDPQKLDEVANKYHGTVSRPPAFSRGEAIQAIPGSQAVAEDVFVLEKGQIGRPVPVPTGYVIPLLEEIEPPRTPELAEVKEKVRTDYIDAQSSQQAQAKALDLAQDLERQERRDLNRRARALRLTPKTTEPVTRTGTIPSVGVVKDLGPRLNNMQPGEVAGPVPIGGGRIVFQLESRQPPDEENFAIQSDPIRQRLLSEKQNMAFALFQDSLKARMTETGDVKIHQAVLERLNASATRQF
ncbi:MAG: peptidyl-prolyl cis-trans isomerase [Acidobacteria bacterium]|nr:peptidyl-prolyl cis-trans isomerase [Acidobacteriota bacterium]